MFLVILDVLFSQTPWQYFFIALKKQNITLRNTVVDTVQKLKLVNTFKIMELQDKCVRYIFFCLSI